MRLFQLFFLSSLLISKSLEDSQLILDSVDEDAFSTLISTEVTGQAILGNYAKFDEATANARKFKSNLLLYITPWNKGGYEAAVKYRGKFTHLVPVWFTIKRVSPEQYEIEGDHEVNQEWIQMAKYGNEDGISFDKSIVVPKIMPRFKADFQYADFAVLTGKGGDVESECTAITKAIMEVVHKYELDGVMMEFGYSQYMMAPLFTLAEALHAEEKELHVTVFPNSRLPDGVVAFDEHVLKFLDELLDGINLMTYDFSSYSQPGPVSPLPWIKNEINSVMETEESRHKFYMGMNFYGYDFVKDVEMKAITGSDLIQLLGKINPRFVWEEQSSEHYFAYKKGQTLHYVFYPTLQSISMRIKLAEEMGVNIAIWEGGQGLEYFFNLF